MIRKSVALAFAASLIVINAFGQGFVACNGTGPVTCTASNVGVGGTTPSNTLHIFTTTNGGGLTVEGLNPSVRFQATSGSPQAFLGIVTSTAGGATYFTGAVPSDLAIRSESSRILLGGLSAGATGPPTLTINGSQVGVGTSVPSAAFHILTNTVGGGLLIEGSASPSVALKTNGSIGGFFGIASTVHSYFTNTDINDLALRTQTLTGKILLGQFGSSSGQTIPATVTISNQHVDVDGTIQASQVIGATYQDVAEWVPSTTKMSPGTVVVVQRGAKNTVMPSAAAYATSVAGVVSEKPGVLLGESSETKAMIATTGRVKVHVDASNGAIEAGDLLVTSNKPGVAMKSQPVDLGGIKIHRPGTLIGKALESLPNGEGDILVLLSLQ